MKKIGSSIKEVLFRALWELISEDIGDGYYLQIQIGTKNVLIGGSTYIPDNMRINGRIERPDSLRWVNSESITGMAIISEEVTYWFRIIGDDGFEVRCISNLMGRSGATLLEVQRGERGRWIAKNGMPLTIVNEPVTFDSDHDMAKGVFNILADYGNPYARFESETGDASDHRFEIDVEKGTLYVDGFSWFSPMHL